jgi:hypothetical protein
MLNEFDLIWNKMMIENSLRINYKNDLINGIFLVHVK